MRMCALLGLLALLAGCQEPSRQETAPSEDSNWFFWTADWHPKEDQIVVGGSNDTFLKLLASSSLIELKNYPYLGTITQAQWHPSQNKLAIATQDGKSKCAILNVEKDTLIALDSITVDGARAIAWNHSGRLLAVGDYAGYLSFFTEEGQLLRRVNTQQRGLIGLDWHPTENRIVAVGEDISLYDYDADRIQTIPDRAEDVLMLCVDWHPSGAFFVTGDYGDFELDYPPLLQYWSENGQRVRTIAESKAEYRNLRWTPTGDLLASTSEKIRLWNQEGALVSEAPAEDLLWGLDWNADGTVLVTTDVKKRIMLWDRDLQKIKEASFGE